jgi:hypothetical protein
MLTDIVSEPMIRLYFKSAYVVQSRSEAVAISTNPSVLFIPYSFLKRTHHLEPRTICRERHTL